MSNTRNLHPEFVLQIRSLHQSLDHFHLKPCGGCALPASQQPCHLCDYYPYGDDPAEDLRCRDMGLTDDDFVRSVNRAGNIALWALKELRKTCAYIGGDSYFPRSAWGGDWDTVYTYRESVHEAEDKARNMEWPTPEEILQIVRSKES